MEMAFMFVVISPVILIAIGIIALVTAGIDYVIQKKRGK